MSGSGLADVVGFVASDSRVTSGVTSASDAEVTVLLGSTAVEDGDYQDAPIPGVSFALFDSSGNQISSPVTFDIVADTGPQVTSWKLATPAVKWIPGGDKSTVTYLADVTSFGNVQYFYVAVWVCCSSIQSWTNTGDQFTTHWTVVLDVTPNTDFGNTNFPFAYGAVDGAGQGGFDGTDSLSPSQPINIPTVQMQLVDPVTDNPSTSLLAGSVVTDDTNLLGNQNRGRVVTGVAADGTAELVVRIAGAPPNEVLFLAPTPDGTIAAIGTTEFQSNVYVDIGPDGTGFALYRAPDDFAQSGTIASSSDTSRNVDLSFQSPDNPGVIGDTNIKIVRPPVVLIHGLWGVPGDWDPFKNNLNTILGGQLPFTLSTAAYNQKLPSISSTVPPLSKPYLLAAQHTANTSSFGLTFAASVVLPQLNNYIDLFKNSKNVAAVQADVVAHSMGGIVTRTMPTYPASFYTSQTFGAGPVHKLITIGTPHLGSPLATDMLSQENACVRNVFATAGMLVAQLVNVKGVSTPVHGAIGDLSGDGSGRSLSSALSAIQQAQEPIATAFVVGNGCGSGSGCPVSLVNAVLLHLLLNQLPCVRDPIVQHLKNSTWPLLFSNQASDAIVPVQSAWDNGRDGSVYPGAIPDVHSKGTKELGFTAPFLLGDSLVATEVIELLNTPRSTSPTYARLY